MQSDTIVTANQAIRNQRKGERTMRKAFLMGIIAGFILASPALLAADEVRVTTQGDVCLTVDRAQAPDQVAQNEGPRFVWRTSLTADQVARAQAFTLAEADSKTLRIQPWKNEPGSTIFARSIDEK